MRGGPIRASDAMGPLFALGFESVMRFSNCSLSRYNHWIFAGFLGVLLTGPAWAENQGDTDVAFPGAQGYGKYATGWRGGEIRYVTSIADSGPGSLRDCVQHDTAGRVCVFAVSGTIEVDEQIRVSPNTYIAGQTAPGLGVQLKVGKVGTSALMIFESHDVLLRYMKFRPGPSLTRSPSVDGLIIESSSNVYIDHASIAFGVDENISIGTEKMGSVDITIANTIAAFGLDKSSHNERRHSKGALICAKDGPNSDCGRITLVANLFAHNRDRNPDISATPEGPVDVVNNVIYDATSQFGEFRNLYGHSWINYVGNVILPGPSTRDRNRPAAIEAFPVEPGNKLEIYEHDNLYLDNRLDMLCDRSVKGRIVDEDAVKQLVDSPAFDLSVDPRPASGVLDHVLNTVGARFGPDGELDSLDRLVIENVLRCDGHRIDHPDEVGGWPDLPELRVENDRDLDGMPDDWETARDGLDPDDPTDAWQDRDDDGWSNLEEYLSVLAGDIQAQ